MSSVAKATSVKSGDAADYHRDRPLRACMDRHRRVLDSRANGL
jgi:hypothetical protein